MTAADEFTTDKWWYMGRRFGRDNKMEYLFLTHMGRGAAYSSGPAVRIIGGAYDVESKNEGQTARIKTATYVKNITRHEKGAEWALLDDAAYKEQQAHAAKKKAADSKGYDTLTLAEVSFIYHNSRNKGAVIAAVIQSIQGGRWV